MKRDVVYILRENIDSYELRYSLRSIDENFPHRKVWFVGGQPSDLMPDGRIRHKQKGITKWDRVKSSLKEIVKNGDITDEFFLFNDDFFVMSEQSENFINFSNGTLEKRVLDIRKRTGRVSNYVRSLDLIRHKLIMRGFDSVSFAVHLPMLLDKEKVKHTLEVFDEPMFRSIYGNINRISYIYHEDVKIYDNITKPQFEDYCSTTEVSFRDGAVGKIIRERFDKPSRFEVDELPTYPHELYTEEGDEIRS